MNTALLRWRRRRFRSTAGAPAHCVLRLLHAQQSTTTQSSPCVHYNTWPPSMESVCVCGVWVGCLAVCVSSVLVPSLFRSARQLSYEFRPTVAADQCPQIPASPSSEVPALFTFDGACSTFAGGGCLLHLWLLCRRSTLAPPAVLRSNTAVLLHMHLDPKAALEAT